MNTLKFWEHKITSDGVPRDTLLDHDRMIERNLIAGHRRKYA